jgi:hypothetical protein
LAGIFSSKYNLGQVEMVPERHFFSHAATFHREKVLAGISERDRFPERTLDSSRAGNGFIIARLFNDEFEVPSM